VSRPRADAAAACNGARPRAGGVASRGGWRPGWWVAVVASINSDAMNSLLTREARGSAPPGRPIGWPDGHSPWTTTIELPQYVYDEYHTRRCLRWSVGLKDHRSSLLVLALAVADKQSYENDGWHRLCPYSERYVGIDVASSLEAAPNHGLIQCGTYEPGVSRARTGAEPQSHLSELGGTAPTESLWLCPSSEWGDGSVHAHQSPHNYAARGGRHHSRQPLSRRTSARLGKSRRGERPSRAATRRGGGRRKESMKGRVNAPRPVAAAPRPIRCVQSVHATRGRRGVARASALLPSHTARPPHPQTARRAYESQSRPSPPFPGVRKGQGSLGLDHRTQQDRGACPTEAFYPARPVARRRIS
jgi:hypothetical protein